jgi:hypothetical protein
MNVSAADREQPIIACNLSRLYGKDVTQDLFLLFPGRQKINVAVERSQTISGQGFSRKE